MISVFEFRRISRPWKQEVWSYLRLPLIVFFMIDFKRIKQMQCTEFNNELVLLIETTNANVDCIYFQRQTDGVRQNPMRRWNIPQSVHKFYASPSTGKFYTTFWNANSQMISEYGYTDGLFLRSVSLLNIDRRLLDCRSYRFVDLNDQVNIVIHSNTRQGGVITVPINNLDEEHVISSRALPNISACLDSVTDQHGNLFILTDEGNSYGIVFAPANQEEQVRFIIRIPKSRIIYNPGQQEQLGFDESKGLIFLSLQTSKRILWYRVARMNV